MGKGRPLIFSFNSGEWSPRMDGRVDLESYTKACKIMENFFPWPQGAAQNRSGSEFIREVSDSTKKSRLFSATTTDNDKWVIEFADTVIRFFKNGVYLDVPVTGTPYLEADLFDLDITQINDVFYIVHEDYEPKKLIKYTEDTWQLASIQWRLPPWRTARMLLSRTAGLTFASTTEMEDVGTWVKIYTATSGFYNTDAGKTIVSDKGGSAFILYPLVVAGDTLGAAAKSAVVVEMLTPMKRGLTDAAYLEGSGVVELDASAAAGTGEQVTLNANTSPQVAVELLQAAADNWTLSVALGAAKYWYNDASGMRPNAAPDLVLLDGVPLKKAATANAMLAGEWAWDNDDATMSIYVLLSSGLDPDTLVTSVATQHRLVYVHSDQDAAAAATAASIGSNYNASAGDLISINGGLVKINDNTNVATELTGEVITKLTDHAATYEWSIFDSAFESGSYPGATIFHEDRLAFALGETILLSDTGNYERFFPGTSDSSSVKLSLLTRERQVIKWMESRDVLVVGTDKGEFVVGEREGALTPSNVYARQQLSHGSNGILRLIAENNILFIEKDGKKLRELTFTFESNDYFAKDLTLFAEHITGSGIVQMAYQSRPIPTVWGVTTEGSLVGLVYIPSHQIIAWLEYKTGITAAGAYDGTDSYESMAISDDEVWVVVSRTLDGTAKRYIEKLNNPFDSDTATDARMLDLYVVDTSLTATLTGLNYVNPEWDVSTTVYASKSKNVSAEDITPVGVAFSSDGTKMYIVGLTNDTVYQYTLTTAWDVSTASYASKSKDVSAEDTELRGVAFSSDGTKMYIVGFINDTVYQYTLTTAWDVSTASYASKSKDVSAEDTEPFGVAFSSDGTKMYIMGNTNDTVYQYTLTTAWDVSTASYASKSKNVSAEDITPVGVAFSSDGTKMYISGDANDTVFQYTLTTAWDVSTTVYASKSKDVSAEDTELRGVAFSSDGTKMYIMGFTNDTVYQYTFDGPSALEYVATYIVDGDPAKVGTDTVNADGEITLLWTPTVNAVAGLTYTSTLQTMRTNAGVGDMGTIQGTLKRIHEVWLRLYRTLAGKAGPTESRLSDLTGTTTIKNGDIKVVDFQGRWDTDGYITIVQEKPSPITVIAIAATVEATDNR